MIEMLEIELPEGRELLLCCRVGDVLVGTLSIRWSESWEYGYFRRMFVMEGFRRQGVGKELAAEALRELARRGCHRVYIQVVGVLSDERKFWSEQGFLVVPPDGFSVPPGAVMMMRDIKPEGSGELFCAACEVAPLFEIVEEEVVRQVPCKKCLKVRG